jgi:hypothetical protein
VTPQSVEKTRVGRNLIGSDVAVGRKPTQRRLAVSRNFRR